MRESPALLIVIAVVASCLLSGAICLFLKRSMKTVHQKVEANEYVAPGGLQLSKQYDRYTHTTEVRSKISRSDDSSSSGTSSCSGGGGSDAAENSKPCRIISVNHRGSADGTRARNRGSADGTRARSRRLPCAVLPERRQTNETVDSAPFFAALVSLSLALSLTACGGQSEPSPSEDGSSMAGAFSGGKGNVSEPKDDQTIQRKRSRDLTC